MNILELPKELLREIWSYINILEDIIRFGATCKLFQSLSFEINRKIWLTPGHRVEIWENILSRDLRHLRELNISFTLNSKNDSKQLDWIEKLTVLSTLHNLKKLVCQFHNAYEQRRFQPKFYQLGQVVKKMTWLEHLDASFPIDNNIGELFKDHQKLTALEIGSYNEGIGYNRLTQVKSLGISVYALDDVFHQVNQMDNLTALDVSWTDISYDEASQISKLTNLEAINVTGIGEDVLNWNVFKSLPKLSSLTQESDAIKEYQYEVLNQLTHLTYLALSSDAETTNQVDLSNLTNLRHLQFNVAFGNPIDFSAFGKLTSLLINNTGIDNQRIQLPRGLKSLTTSCIYENIDLCQVDCLEQLQVESDTWSEQICSLTDLRHLSFYSQITSGVIKTFKALTGLRTLSLATLQDQYVVDALKDLTQLYELTIREINLTDAINMRTLRHQLPYVVYKH